jgi:hypothetical protein
MYSNKDLHLVRGRWGIGRGEVIVIAIQLGRSKAIVIVGEGMTVLAVVTLVLTMRGHHRGYNDGIAMHEGHIYPLCIDTSCIAIHKSAMPNYRVQLSWTLNVVRVSRLG